MTALQNLGFVRRGVNLQPIYSALEWIFQNYEGLSIKDITYESLEQIQEDIRKIVYKQPFNLPAEFAFLGRAVGTLVGLTTGLYPDINYVEASQPVIDKIKSAQKSELREVIINEAKNVGKILLKIPNSIQNVLDKAERDQLVVKVHSKESKKPTQRFDRHHLYPIISFFCAVIIVSAIYLVIQEFILLGLFLFIFSFIFLVGALIYSRRKLLS